MKKLKRQCLRGNTSGQLLCQVRFQSPVRFLNLSQGLKYPWKGFTVLQPLGHPAQAKSRERKNSPVPKEPFPCVRNTDSRKVLYFTELNSVAPLLPPVSILSAPQRWQVRKTPVPITCEVWLMELLTLDPSPVCCKQGHGTQNQLTRGLTCGSAAY